MEENERFLCTKNINSYFAQRFFLFFVKIIIMFQILLRKKIKILNDTRVIIIN